MDAGLKDVNHTGKVLKKMTKTRLSVGSSPLQILIIMKDFPFTVPPPRDPDSPRQNALFTEVKPYDISSVV